jgi:hypothetical protein
MKPTILMFAFLMVTLSGCALVVHEPVTSMPASGGKVAVCHKGKKTLYVAPAALKAHLNHGDYRGVCR